MDLDGKIRDERFDKVAQEGFGLKGIRERANLLGGKATIESSPGKGTRIRVELPMEEDDG